MYFYQAIVTVLSSREVHVDGAHFDLSFPYLACKADQILPCSMSSINKRVL